MHSSSWRDFNPLDTCAARRTFILAALWWARQPNPGVERLECGLRPDDCAWNEWNVVSARTFVRGTAGTWTPPGRSWVERLERGRRPDAFDGVGGVFYVGLALVVLMAIEGAEDTYRQACFTRAPSGQRRSSAWDGVLPGVDVATDTKARVLFARRSIREKLGEGGRGESLDAAMCSLIGLAPCNRSDVAARGGMATGSGKEQIWQLRSKHLEYMINDNLLTRLKAMAAAGQNGAEITAALAAAEANPLIRSLLWTKADVMSAALRLVHCDRPRNKDDAMIRTEVRTSELAEQQLALEIAGSPDELFLGIRYEVDTAIQMELESRVKDAVQAALREIGVYADADEDDLDEHFLRNMLTRSPEDVMVGGLKGCAREIAKWLDKAVVAR